MPQATIGALTPSSAPAICSARRRLAGFLLDGFILGITFIVGWYAWCFLRYRTLQSPGFQLLGMMVIDQRTGAKPSLGRGLVRGITKWLLLSQIVALALLALDQVDRAARAVDVVPDRYLSVGTVVLAFVVQIVGLVISTCWLLTNPERQQLWDKLAGTVVVRTRESLPVPQRASQPVRTPPERPDETARHLRPTGPNGGVADTDRRRDSE